MIRVLVVTGLPPARPTVLAEAIRTLASAGAAVSVTGPVAGLDGLDGLAQVAAFVPPTPRQRREAGLTNLSEAVWTRAQRHPQTRQAAARADVIVALDQPSIHTAWQLGRRNRAAEVVFGLAPALRWVEGRSRRPVRQAVRRLFWRGPSAEFVLAKTRERYQRAISRR